MPIAIQPNQSERVRLLAERHPNLTPVDLAAKTGLKLKAVKAALSNGRRDTPKSRAR